LHITAGRRHTAIVDLLLTYGAEVAAADQWGWTALHMVAHQDDDVAFTERLQQHGADVHARDQWGRTALHIAARSQHRAIMELLLAHGANVHATDTAGRTAQMECPSAGTALALSGTIGLWYYIRRWSCVELENMENTEGPMCGGCPSIA